MSDERTTKLIVAGVVQVRPEHVDAYLGALEPMVRATRSETGCISYGFYQDPFQPGVFRLFEEWSNEDALEAHFSTPHMAAFRAEIADYPRVRSEIYRYSISQVESL